MINWKSLILFLLTLIILVGLLVGAVYHGYNKGLSILNTLHPEILKTPESATVYSENRGLIKSFVRYKEPEQGYSLMVPKGYRVIKRKGDPSFTIEDPFNKWEITIKEKLLRYDETIKSKGYLSNPDGDYYVLLREIFQEKKNPIMLFQKMLYLSSSTKSIKTIVTPNFPLGYLIVGKTGSYRSETYRVFDDNYWHNIFVTIKDPKYPHYKIETVIASIKNDVYKSKVESNKLLFNQ